VQIVVPRLDDAPSPPPPTEAAPTRGAEAPARPPASSGKRTASYVVGGAGIVAVGVGAFFGLAAASKVHDAKSRCSLSYCVDPQAVSWNDEGRRDANVANVAFGVGVLALATATYLFFTSTPTSPAAPVSSIEVSPRGAALGGRF
jgi:hypothetical protein